jgi:hypothetical protein
LHFVSRLVSLAAKASLSFSAKESNQRKLPAAPASLNVCATTSGVVAEPDDAGFLRLTVACAFAWFNYCEEMSMR